MNTSVHTVRGWGGRGFTLIELLVVVSIVALLISILLPSLSKARQKARTSVCRSNLHQLALAVRYYAGDNSDRLPYILGTDIDGDGRHNNAPYYQYHQLFHFWGYLKGLKIFICPSARDHNSVVAYREPDAPSRHSYYTVRKADDRYIQAYRRNWWPDINPTDYPGPLVLPLYTEYWFNDFSEGATLVDGTEVFAINGGKMGRIPHPNLAVVISDARWDLLVPNDGSPGPKGPEFLRHDEGLNFAFLDGHVSWLRADRFLDSRGTANGTRSPKDYDAYGNRPFYAWGLTSKGLDALEGHNSTP